MVSVLLVTVLLVTVLLVTVQLVTVTLVSVGNDVQVLVMVSRGGEWWTGGPK